MSIHSVMSAVLASLVITSAAASAETPSSQTAALVQAKQKVARAADRTKGGHRQLLLLEQRRLDRMIGDLERGETVDPAEIDQALERSKRATW